jgi:hypothetical protein
MGSLPSLWDIGVMAQLNQTGRSWGVRSPPQMRSRRNRGAVGIPDTPD